MEKLRVGTSGWVYKGWAGAFYPKGLPAKDQFAFYATKFRTVEINNSFYRLPTQSIMRGWEAKAPPGFVYALKGSRFITQMKKLNVKAEPVENFCQLAALLGEHLGPTLWQLPPGFTRNSQRLERFLHLLPRGQPHAIEFRHPSWLTPETKQMLETFQVALVSVSSGRMPVDFSITAPFIYLRFHGLAGGAAHDYTRDELQPWAEHCRAALRQGLAVYAYFNNDGNCRAPKNALELIKMVES